MYTDSSIWLNIYDEIRDKTSNHAD